MRFCGNYYSGLRLRLHTSALPYRCTAGTVDTVLSYCHGCLSDRSLLDELPYLQSKGVGVINASPLCMGLLTKQGPPAWHPAPQALKDAAAEATARAAAKGVDIAKLGLLEALRCAGCACGCDRALHLGLADAGGGVGQVPPPWKCARHA